MKKEKTPAEHVDKEPHRLSELAKDLLLPSRQMARAKAQADIVTKGVQDTVHVAKTAIEEYLDEKRLSADFLDTLEQQSPVIRKYIFFKQPSKNPKNYIGSHKDFGEIRINIIDASPDVLAKLEFPMGHSVHSGKIYIEHPLKPRMYLPYDQYFELIEKEQSEEEINALMMLGAREYYIERIEIEEKSVGGKWSAGLTGLIDGTKATAKIEQAAEAEKRNVTRIKDTVCLPPRKPRKPQLLWLKNDPMWNEIIRCRMNGASGTWTHELDVMKGVSFSAGDAKSLDVAISKLQKAGISESFQLKYDQQRRKRFRFCMTF